jgi:hypothetical protein
MLPSVPAYRSLITDIQTTCFKPKFSVKTTKMPLPAIIKAEFDYVNPTTTQESDYYGAYNMLLVHAFPMLDGYVVHPQVRLYMMYPLKANRGYLRLHRLSTGAKR